MLSAELGRRGHTDQQIEIALRMFRWFYQPNDSWTDAKLTAADDGTIVSAIASTARMNGMFRQMIKEIADVAASLLASSGKTAP